LAERLAVLRGVEVAELPPALLNVVVRRYASWSSCTPPIGSSCATRRAARGAGFH